MHCVLFLFLFYRTLHWKWDACCLCCVCVVTTFLPVLLPLTVTPVCQVCVHDFPCEKVGSLRWQPADQMSIFEHQWGELCHLCLNAVLKTHGVAQEGVVMWSLQDVGVVMQSLQDVGQWPHQGAVALPTFYPLKNCSLIFVAKSKHAGYCFSIPLISVAKSKHAGYCFSILLISVAKSRLTAYCLSHHSMTNGHKANKRSGS